jgi:general secretion pathway protein A
MDYYNLLHIKKEPFSNSPEPEFLFASLQHSECLQMLELAVRLRRGLNIVIGDVGTGKTTLCRKLIQNLSAAGPAGSPEIETHLLLDPALGATMEFLRTVYALLGGIGPSGDDTEWQLKEKIKDALFLKGVEEEKIVALIIDEGQKLPPECLEILREFLNYETNSFKLLQIVIFAQKEIEKTLMAHANLLDRVNVLYPLKALTFRQTRDMIQYRVRVARESELVQSRLFSFGGLLAVYRATGGYPRKIVSLCHQVVLKMIIRGRSKAGFFFVLGCVGGMSRPVFRKLRWAALGLVAILAAGAFSLTAFDRNDIAMAESDQAVAVHQTASDVHVPQSDESPETALKLSMPDTLGTITFQRNMTLWRILESIYGYAGPELIGKVVEANPHVRDVDLITEGLTIRMPAIRAKSARPYNFTLVTLRSGKDLQKIYRYYLEESPAGFSGNTMIFSYWSGSGEIIHTLSLKKIFTDDGEARRALASLPPEAAAGAEILSGWTPETQFFNRAVMSRQGDRRSDEI